MSKSYQQREEKTINGREKTKDAHTHKSRQVVITLIGLFLPAVVFAAPTLTTDIPLSPSLLDGAIEEATVSATDEPSPTFALEDTSGDADKSDPKHFTRFFQIPSTGRQGWNSTRTWNPSRSRDLFNTWLPSITVLVKDPSGPVNGSNNTPVIPAPGAIVLGTVGLLLVRVLRQRRVIV